MKDICCTIEDGIDYKMCFHNTEKISISGITNGGHHLIGSG